ncbi:hypothetical protein JTE90_023054 [Oedothorax gibbosus]|uniref:sphingosine kinase n=1 Tax=Oedothorax gibbosus TaxID=931172 RepID=A0AAV6V215_9ARAC|nr:hypothetical protein JTE90_023054 [Oedothorax gibbosus]
MALPETELLKDDFQSHHLILTEKALLINGKGKIETEKLCFNDVIGCHAFREKPNKIKNETDLLSAYFCVYAYPLKTIGYRNKQMRRDRRTLSFKMDSFDNQDENFNVVEKWHRAINCLLRGISCLRNGEVSIPTEIPIPKKFLILINPKSGPGKAYNVFKERVLPLLVESDTHYELLVTDRANCARDYIMNTDLAQWDGIVVVSGDGLLFEVYNGLMARPDWKETVKIPIGVIPGGSGNGLAKAISHADGEPYDTVEVTPSVLNIIKGKVSPMDLVRVETAKQHFYSFLSIGWGLMADIDIESERLRVLGESRFTVWAIYRAISLRKYKGKLSYLPVQGYKYEKNAKIFTEPKPKRSKTIDCNLAWSDDPNLNGKDKSIFRSKSFGTQSSDLDAVQDDSVRLLKYSLSSGQYSDPFEPILNTDPSSEIHETRNGIPHIHCTEEMTDKSSPMYSPDSTTYCPPLEEPVPDNWTTIEDDFVLVYACHQTHLSADIFFAPEAKLDDGIMWLIVIGSKVSRAEVIYFLTCLQTGDHVHIPYVEVIPVHAFRLEPASPDSYLTVDGEAIQCCAIQAEVLPSVARVMTR